MDQQYIRFVENIIDGSLHRSNAANIVKKKDFWQREHLTMISSAIGFIEECITRIITDLELHGQHR